NVWPAHLQINWDTAIPCKTDGSHRYPRGYSPFLAAVPLFVWLLLHNPPHLDGRPEPPSCSDTVQQRKIQNAHPVAISKFLRSMYKENLPSFLTLSFQNHEL